MASYEKGKYQYTDGSVIYYNESETAQAFKQISTICGEVSEYSKNVLESDKCFDGFPQKYADLFPTPRYSSVARGIDANLSGIQRTVTTKMGKIINAIVDYCNGGGFSEASQKILDALLSNVPPTTLPDDGSGPGGTPGDDGAGLSDNDTLEPSEEESPIPNGGFGGNETNGNLNNLDEEIVISESTGSNINGSGSGVVVPSVGELEDADLETDSDISGSTLSGFTSFVVPGSNKDEMVETKSAGVLGAVGLAAAAAIALGAKIYHDKTDEDNEENEFETDDLDVGTSENISYSSNKEMLKMKKKIFNIGDDD